MERHVLSAPTQRIFQVCTSCLLNNLLRSSRQLDGRTDGRQARRPVASGAASPLLSSPHTNKTVFYFWSLGVSLRPRDAAAITDRGTTNTSAPGPRLGGGIQVAL